MRFIVFCLLSGATRADTRTQKGGGGGVAASFKGKGNNLEENMGRWLGVSGVRNLLSSVKPDFTDESVCYSNVKQRNDAWHHSIIMNYYF